MASRLQEIITELRGNPTFADLMTELANMHLLAPTYERGMSALDLAHKEGQREVVLFLVQLYEGDEKWLKRRQQKA